jgi:hypothetical protein
MLTVNHIFILYFVFKAINYPLKYIYKTTMLCSILFKMRQPVFKAGTLNSYNVRKEFIEACMYVQTSHNKRS